MTEEDLISLAEFRARKNRLLGRLLNKTYRFMSELSIKFLTQKGYGHFRLGHIVALIHIDIEGVNINSMAQKAGMTKQGMSKLVKELMDEGYVFTEKDPNDARAIIVKLTDLGIKCILDWKECTEYVDSSFQEIIGLEKLDTLKDILSELLLHAGRECGPIEYDYKSLQKKIFKH